MKPPLQPFSAASSGGHKLLVLHEKHDDPGFSHRLFGGEGGERREPGEGVLHMSRNGAGLGKSRSRPSFRPCNLLLPKGRGFETAC
jgi:hypothetical protein